MKKRLLVGLLAFISFSNSYSQLPSDFYNPSVIRHKLQDLSVVGSVLYIAAHPDDENTRLITYLTKERHLRTGYLSLTRGDGGQNLIGTEQGTDLGVLRSQELLAARRIDGAEQFFSSATDFGYSKNPEETFRIWDKDKVLKDVVTVIRLFRPDVIICRFPTTGEGGHGHHTASAILAEQAFDLAADEKYIDNRKQPAWKATRLLWNTFNFGTTNTTSENQLKVDVGGYNSILGKSYGEIAAESRSQHRSQGFGSAKTRGEQFEYFKHIKGIPAKTDIMDDIDLSWKRYPAFAKYHESITGLIREADAELKEGKNKEFIQKLIAIKLQLKYGYNQSMAGKVMTIEDKGEIDDIWLFSEGSEQSDIEYRIRKVDELILAGSGIYLEVLGTKQFFVSGESMKADINIINRGGLRAHYRCAMIHSFSDCNHTDSTLLVFNKAFKKTVSLDPLERTVLFRQNRMPLLSTNVILFVEGDDIWIRLPLLYKKIDPSVGEIYYPVSIVPGMSITRMPEPLVNGKQQQVSLKVKANMNVRNAYLKSFSTVSGTNRTDSIGSMAAGEEKTITVDLADFWKSADLAQLNFGFILNYKDSSGKWKMDASEQHYFSYPHISEWNVFYPANIDISRLDVVRKVKKIGYISGAGDKIAESLRQLGYQVDELSDDQISSIDLSQYPVIITGIRAHNTRDILQSQHARLMEYIKNGGRLIVQYNTNSRVGPLNTKIGPYPFSISRERVTDENAEVKFLDPKNPFVNKPYKLDSNDFAGWIQERSIYQASERDSSHYKSLFSMHDPGENESDGSLIYCKYGKGTFIYTGLVFFRELPAGVPGAYKLFINLIEAKL